MNHFDLQFASDTVSMSFFLRAEAFLRNLVDEKWEQLNEGGWFLSPFQHVVENLILLPIHVFCLWFGFQVMKFSSNTFPVTYLKHSNKSEKFLAALLLLSWGILYFHKKWRDAIPYLLQPCHMLSVLSAMIFFLPKRWTLTHVLALISIHLQWSTVLAIATPDTKDHIYRFETLNFWMEHYLLIAVPFLILRAFDFSKILNWRVSFAVWGFFMMYHYYILFPISLRTMANVNYILKPPPGPLELLGKYYRLPMGLFTLIFTLATGKYIIPLQTRIVRKFKKELQLKTTKVQ